MNTSTIVCDTPPISSETAMGSHIEIMADGCTRFSYWPGVDKTFVIYPKPEMDEAENIFILVAERILTLKVRYPVSHLKSLIWRLLQTVGFCYNQ